MFHKLLLRMSVNFMAVLMIVLLVLGALVSRFMWLNQLQSGLEDMKQEAEEIAENYEYLYDFQISSRVFSKCINDAATDSSVWLLDKNGLRPRKMRRNTCAPCSKAERRWSFKTDLRTISARAPS